MAIFRFLTNDVVRSALEEQKMADALQDIHRAFLQAFLKQPCRTETETKRLYEALLKIQPQGTPRRGTT